MTAASREQGAPCNITSHGCIERGGQRPTAATSELTFLISSTEVEAIEYVASNALISSSARRPWERARIGYTSPPA
jgi:hypothetical protein